MTFEVGDFAWAEFNDGSGGERALLTQNGWVGIRGPIRRDAEGSFTFHPMAGVNVTPGFPDVGRLLNLIGAPGASLRSALVEYLVPVPPPQPKPTEPTRLGATARDRDGRVWVRVSRMGWWAPEGDISIFSAWKPYSDIDVVETDVVVNRDSG